MNTPNKEPIVLIFIEPGSAALTTDDEFARWYDTQHMPAMLAVPGFYQGARLLQSADTELSDSKPRCAALYDINGEGATFDSDVRACMKDWEEKDESGNLKSASTKGYMNVRTYRPLERPLGKPSYVVHEEFGKTKKTVEGGLMVLVSMEVPGDEVAVEELLHGFYEEEHIAALQKVPGWLRSRRFVLEHHEEFGEMANSVGNAHPPKYLIVNEYESTDALRMKEYGEALATEWKDRVVGAAIKNGKFERFMMKVHKVFPAASS